MIKIEQRYCQNIVYLLSVLAFALIYFCIYYWKLLPAIFADSNMSAFNLLPLFELSIKNVWIWLLSAVIIDKLLKQKMFYSVGLNLDRFAIRDIFYGILTALLGFSVVIGFTYFCATNSAWNLLFDSAPAWIINNLWLINDSAVEELIFRGFVFQTIFRKNNSIIAILVSSLFFAGAHFLQANWDIVFFINIFLAGILFCQMYAITKSLWSAVAFHTTWNIAVFNIKINSISIEFEYITIIVLVLLILLVSFSYKPSYKINKHFLLNT